MVEVVGPGSYVVVKNSICCGDWWVSGTEIVLETDGFGSWWLGW